MLRIKEKQLNEIVTKTIKQVLSEVAPKHRKYQTTLVMYSWYDGFLRENERTNDHMDHLIRRYNNVIRKYKKEGCLVFTIRFRGRRFATIVDTNKRIISFMTILQNEDPKNLVLRREDIPELSELLLYYNINPNIFGIRNIPRPRPSIPKQMGNPLSPDEKRELRHGQVFTNWDMMYKAPKKWRKMRDGWEWIGNEAYENDTTQTTPINESQLRKIVESKVRTMLKEEYGNSLLSVLATVAQYMGDFGYNEESQLIEKYIGSAMSEDDIEFNNQILQAIENVEKDVTRRREESDDENVHWDDFEDFVSMLSSARQRYLLHFGDDNPKYTLMNVGINRPPKRYLSESFIRKTIKESIKKVLGEEWYPEEDDDISDYSYGAIYNIYIGDIDMNEMDPQVIEALNNVKDETVENENSYISCLIQNVILKPDQFNAYELYVNVAVSAPDMPTNEIERGVVDVIWYWIERKTGKRFVNIQLQDEKPVFDRRVRNS